MINTRAPDGANKKQDFFNGFSHSPYRSNFFWGFERIFGYERIFGFERIFVSKSIFERKYENHFWEGSWKWICSNPRPGKILYCHQAVGVTTLTHEKSHFVASCLHWHIDCSRSNLESMIELDDSLTHTWCHTCALNWIDWVNLTHPRFKFFKGAIYDKSDQRGKYGQLMAERFSFPGTRVWGNSSWTFITHASVGSKIKSIVFYI